VESGGRSLRILRLPGRRVIRRKTRELGRTPPCGPTLRESDRFFSPLSQASLFRSATLPAALALRLLLPPLLPSGCG
jgi:hypothetical protein